MNRDAPLFITREALQVLAGNVISAANGEPHLRLIDPFIELVDCDWCHRRIGEKNLINGMCPYCFLSIRGAIVIGRKVCSQCKGVD